MRIECKKGIENNEYIISLDEEGVKNLEILRTRPEPQPALEPEEEMKWIVIRQINKRMQWVKKGGPIGWSKTRQHIVRFLKEGPKSYKELRKHFFWLTATSMRMSLMWALKIEAIQLVDKLYRPGKNSGPESLTRAPMSQGEQVAVISREIAQQNRDTVLNWLALLSPARAIDIQESCAYMSLRTIQRHLFVLVRTGNVLCLSIKGIPHYSIVDQTEKDSEQEQMF